MSDFKNVGICYKRNPYDEGLAYLRLKCVDSNGNPLPRCIISAEMIEWLVGVVMSAHSDIRPENVSVIVNEETNRMKVTFEADMVDIECSEN